MKKLFSTLIIVLLFSNLIGQSNFELNCFSILVGKDASVDGSVFFAHNEDDARLNFVDLHKVPRLKHSAGEQQIFVDQLDSIDEVDETYGYLWITGAGFIKEQYLNEWGVAISSNGCRSKVVDGEAKIQHNLRRIVIERARTAREAVKIAGALVEKYGYTYSGRTYLIADPNEAWVLEVTYSKRWVAKRLPDDEVSIIPNYYVIDNIDISDTSNCLSSPDIIEYAITKGWYEPGAGKYFNFRNAYSHEDSRDAISNIARKWVILNELSEKQYKIDNDFPFSFKPKNKVSIQELMDAMQNHYENTRFANNPSNDNGCPHSNSIDTLSVCNGFNDYSCITQLRNWLPADIGNIMWIAPRYPCIQPFIPWYYGITKIPAAYEKENYADALQGYNNKNREYKAMYPDHACWIFDDFAAKTDIHYGKEIESQREWKENFETEVFNTIKKQEKEITEIYKSNPDKARKMLTEITNRYAEKALTDTKEKLDK